MNTTLWTLLPHPEGEQPSVEEFSATAETFAGRVHVEWDSAGLVTPLGQLPFFVEYLKQAGLFAGWAADCPLTFSSPNAPSKHDLLGTVLLSIRSDAAAGLRDRTRSRSHTAHHFCRRVGVAVPAGQRP